MNPRDGARWLRRLLNREPSPRRLFDGIDTRIAVAGTYGRRTTARWLCEVLTERGHDTCALLGGEEPCVVYDGFEFPAGGGPDGLVESIRAFDPGDALIVENGGPDERTMRLVNARIDPRHVLLTNVRPDPGGLGDRWAAVRTVARSVPRGAHVVSGEDDPDVHRHLAAELARRDATITRVPVPDEHADVPGSECVYAMDWLLRSVDKLGLGERTGDYLDRLRTRWTGLPGGRVYVADAATDVETLERIRRSLVGGDPVTVQPLVVLRDGEPARTESYVRYLNDLADGGFIDRARIVGSGHAAIAREVGVPVTTHDREDPAAVLDAALADGRPVWAVANAPSPFFADLREEIRLRAAAERREFHPATAGVPAPQVVTVDSADPAACLWRVAPARRNVLVVDFAGDPGAWMDEWARGDPRGRLCVVTAGGVDSAVASCGGTVAVETVVDPADLDRIGRLVDAYLAGWDGPTAVCCGPATALFGTVGYGAALGIIRALAERTREAGGVAYFSVDPGAHDDRILRALRRAVDPDAAEPPKPREATGRERVPAGRGGRRFGSG